MAKYLWRDELIFFKHSFDQEMKATYLCRMLEWRMELDHNWSVRLGLLGRGLKKRLPADLWTELEGTYVGAGLEENWNALFSTIFLFRKLAVDVGERLGCAYPHELDRRMLEYLRGIQTLKR